MSKSAFYALGIASRPSRCDDYTLVIELFYRPESVRTATSFYVVDAGVVPWTALVAGLPDGRETLEQIRVENENSRKMGKMGSYTAVLRCNLEVGNLWVTVPYSFDAETFAVFGTKPVREWKENLKKMVNEGIVVHR